jgi:hypothetical protein
VKSENDKILSMLEEGTITAAEAEELLDAVAEENNISETTRLLGPRPDLAAVRSAWRLPFNISLLIMAFSASLLWRTRRAAGLARLLRALFLFPAALLSGLSALFLYLSQNGPWLYLRLRADDADRFALSLPFPLHWIRDSLRFVQTQLADQEAQQRLEAAAEFLEAVETSHVEDPLYIDLTEEGNSVEIYLV